jgi:hypothetical protein
MKNCLALRHVSFKDLGTAFNELLDGVTSE